MELQCITKSHTFPFCEQEYHFFYFCVRNGVYFYFSVRNGVYFYFCEHEYHIFYYLYKNVVFFYYLYKNVVFFYFDIQLCRIFLLWSTGMSYCQLWRVSCRWGGCLCCRWWDWWQTPWLPRGHRYRLWKCMFTMQWNLFVYTVFMHFFEIAWCHTSWQCLKCSWQ